MVRMRILVVFCVVQSHCEQQLSHARANPLVTEILSTVQDALHAASRDGDIDHVQSLLEQGADPNAQEDQFGPHPIIHRRRSAVQCVAELTMLIFYAAGSTPLHWAGQLGQLGVAELLLDYGAIVSATERKYGSTPLHTARCFMYFY